MGNDLRASGSAQLCGTSGMVNIAMGDNDAPNLVQCNAPLLQYIQNDLCMSGHASVDQRDPLLPFQHKGMHLIANFVNIPESGHNLLHSSPSK